MLIRQCEVDDKVRFTTAEGAELKPYWLGLRMDMSDYTDTSIVGKQKKVRGLPNHPLLQNLSLFLSKEKIQEVMEITERLRFDEDNTTIINNEDNITDVKKIADLLQEVKWGLWAAEDSQLKDGEGAVHTVQSLVDGASLQCRILSAAEVEVILGQRCGSIDKLPNYSLKKLEPGTDVMATCSMYNDKNYITMMTSDILKNLPVVLYEWAVDVEERADDGNIRTEKQSGIGRVCNI